MSINKHADPIIGGKESSDFDAQAKKNKINNKKKQTPEHSGWDPPKNSPEDILGNWRI